MDLKRTPLYGSLLGQNDIINNKKAKVNLPGRFLTQSTILPLDESTLSKHILLIGGTGCGKSNVFYHLVAQIKPLLSQDDVMIIFDTKGDYYKLFGDANSIVLGNSTAFSNISEKWNVFREILSDGWEFSAIKSNTNEIAWSMFRDAINRSKDAFFPNAARDLFTSILLCMIEAGRQDAVYKKESFFNSELLCAFEESTIFDVKALLESHPTQSAVTSYIGDGQNGQALGVYAELLSVFRQIFTGVFADKGSFSIRNFVKQRKGKTLFIEYDMSIGNTLGPIYSLLFDLALKEALGRNSGRGDVYLICDEFKLLPLLQHIENGVNFGRSMGVKVVAGLQSINQLYEVYGEHRGKNIVAGFSSIFAFRANDPDTRNYISSLYGKSLILERRKSISNSVVEEQRIVNVVEDWDLNSLSIGEAVVGLPFAPPFRFHFDLYK